MISVGIDVSKSKSMVCFLKPGGEIVKKPFEIAHTKDDLHSLIDLIRSFEEEVRVVLEDTGHYHWPIVYTLADHGVFVSSVNALRMKKYCSQDLRKAKNDRLDSIHIASYGITYWSELRPFDPGEGIYRELRLLSRQYSQIIELSVKSKVYIQSLLDKVMPGIERIFPESDKKKLLNVAKRYYHFDHILSMGEKKFKEDFCKWAKKQRYRCYERSANELFALVQSGISALPNTTSCRIAVTEAVRRIQHIDESRIAILTQMTKLAKTLPEYSVVKSMPCIGDILTPLLIAEIGDIRRFKNKHSLVAYAGIDPPIFQSGNFYGTEQHITKRGNSYLRKYRYNAMRSILQLKPEGDPIYELILKKRNEGKAANEAMIAGLNKFLRIYYGKVMELYRSTDA